MTGLVWVPDPSDWARIWRKTLQESILVVKSWWGDHLIIQGGILSEKLLFNPKPFLARSEGSGVQIVIGVGNLQHLNSFSIM